MPEYEHGFRMDEAALRRLPRLHARLPHRRDPREERQGARAAGALHRLWLLPHGLHARGVSRPPRARSRSSTASPIKVAIPSPVLYGHFPLDVRPEHIAQGLLAVGFDAVWDYGVDTAARRQGHRRLHGAAGTGARPVISITCAVVVRLMQVSYPRMLEQAIRIHPPREVAGREVKRRYSRELGLAPDEIAAIYVTPCQARTVSILQPAEGGSSYLDGAIGIPQLYNDVLAAARERRGQHGADRPELPCALGHHAALVHAPPARRAAQAAPLPGRHRPAQRDPRVRRHREGQAPRHRLPASATPAGAAAATATSRWTTSTSRRRSCRA